MKLNSVVFRSSEMNYLPQSDWVAVGWQYLHVDGNTHVATMTLSIIWYVGQVTPTNYIIFIREIFGSNRAHYRANQKSLQARNYANFIPYDDYLPIIACFIVGASIPQLNVILSALPNSEWTWRKGIQL